MPEPMRDAGEPELIHLQRLIEAYRNNDLRQSAAIGDSLRT